MLVSGALEISSNSPLAKLLKMIIQKQWGNGNRSTNIAHCGTKPRSNGFVFASEEPVFSCKSWVQLAAQSHGECQIVGHGLPAKKSILMSEEQLAE